jgi:hypothetical protein
VSFLFKEEFNMAGIIDAIALQHFIGQEVQETNTDTQIAQRLNRIGTIIAVHNTPVGIDMEYSDGARHQFIPDSVTNTSTEGNIGLLAPGRRRFEILKAAGPT